jgi:hypothetical protein
VLAFGATAPALADSSNLENGRSLTERVIHAPLRLLTAARGLLVEARELLRISAAPGDRDSSAQNAPTFTTKKEPEVDPLGDG